MSHWDELRKRLLIWLISLLCLFFISLYFSSSLFSWFINPLLQRLPKQHLISTELIAPVLVPLQFASYLALVMSLPILAWQLRQFIKPALFREEKIIVDSALLCGGVLLLSGLAFAYYLLLPGIFTLLVSYVPNGVEFMPDISHYLNFCLRLMLAFSLAFQLPLVIALLSYFDIFNHQQLANFRRYWLVLAFIIGMLLTPPDVISQICVAIPLTALYEIGMVLSRLTKQLQRSVA